MKVNYDLELERIISENKGKKPTLLLHSCCGPCSTAVITRLINYFDITIYYYNPNIEPIEEYLKRKEEQLKVVKELGVKFIDSDYENDVYRNAVKGLEDLPEGSKRCFLCFKLRLYKTGVLAKEKGFVYFGTTLTVSPHKNSEVINLIGKELEEEVKVNYLYSDFKKKEGYKISIQLSNKYNLYRQNYCGCLFSKQENLKDS